MRRLHCILYEVLDDMLMLAHPASDGDQDK